MVDFYLLYHVFEFWVSFCGLEDVSPELAAQDFFAQGSFSDQFALIAAGSATVHGITAIRRFVHIYCGIAHAGE
jgi:hypothetical protein